MGHLTRLWSVLAHIVDWLLIEEVACYARERATVSYLGVASPAGCAVLFLDLVLKISVVLLQVYYYQSDVILAKVISTTLICNHFGNFF